MNSFCILTLSKYGDQFERLIKTLFETHPDLKLDQIYVVDDGLDESIKEKWKVHYIQGEKPFIFARNFNLGIKNIPSHLDVFFIGDDVMPLTVNAIDLLAKTVYSRKELGMAAPVVCGSVGNFYQQFGALQKPTTREELQTLPAYNSTLIFIAVYLKRELIDKVGPIPESLVGYGFEDNYYSLIMGRQGYTWLIDPTVLVYHGWGKYPAASSYLRSGQNPTELMEINRQIFKKISEDC